MKPVQFIAACILLCFFAKPAAYGQSKDSLKVFSRKPYAFTATKFDSIRRISSSAGIYKNKAVTNDYSFSVYNKTTKNNDLYLLNNNSAQYSRSDILIENNFRNNKIDSFNPAGAPNVQSGMLMGVFNLLVKNK